MSRSIADDTIATHCSSRLVAGSRLLPLRSRPRSRLDNAAESRSYPLHRENRRVSPELTVIVVNHNTRDDLVACLGSLPAAAASLPTEVIVVDSASDDGSIEAVRGAFKAARVLPCTSNRGFAHACNLGMEAARAPLAAVLNADVLCAPGCLDRMASFLRERPRAGAVGPLLRNSDGSLQTSAYRFPTLPVEFVGIFGLRSLLPLEALRRSPRVQRLLPRTGHFDAHDRTRRVDYVTGACIVLRRDAFEQIGGFDENFFLYYEEIDLCRRLHAAGWHVFHLPEATAVHHLNRSGEQQPRLTFLARQQSRLRFHAKHRGPAAFLALRAMLGARVAAAGVGRRVGRPLLRTDGLGSEHYFQVLRWCRRPSSMPAGHPDAAPASAPND